MPARTPLAPDQVDDALTGLAGWTYEDDQLRKRFTFADFREAVAFIVRVAFEAEAMDHHPDLHNVYNRVDIALATHDAGNKVTEMDVRLARAIEGLAAS